MNTNLAVAGLGGAALVTLAVVFSRRSRQIESRISRMQLALSELQRQQEADFRRTNKRITDLNNYVDSTLDDVEGFVGLERDEHRIIGKKDA